MARFYFHGSDDYLPKGSVLRNCVNYEGKWGGTGFYRGLEKHRPEDMRPHNKSVFMVKEFDDLEYCGGGEEFTFIVCPQGDVSKHDMFWSSKVSCLLDEGYDISSPEVKEAAFNYWEGIASVEPCWEYTCDKAGVVRTYDWDYDTRIIELEKENLESKYTEKKHTSIAFNV